MKTSRLAVALLFFYVSSAFGATPIAPANWGTPDQSWGTRRPVTVKDRDLITEYRSRKRFTYVTDFKDINAFHRDWQPISDDKPGLKACRRAENVQPNLDGLRLKTLSAPSDCKTKWSTGYAVSHFQQKYGFFEARIKIADVSGMNNAFWLTTKDSYEIDVTEYRLPNYDHMNLCNWDKSIKDHTVGMQVQFKENFSDGFHDFGVLWTRDELIYEVDGNAVGVIQTRDSIHEAADVRFSSALADWAGKGSDNPVGHDVIIQSLRVSAL